MTDVLTQSSETRSELDLANKQFFLERDSVAKRCYTYLQGESILHHLADQIPDIHELMADIHKQLGIFPFETSGIVVSKGEARLSVDPRMEKNMVMFHGITSGAKSSDGQYEFVVGRSVFERRALIPGAANGHLQVKPVYPFRDGSDAIRLSVPRQAEAGELLREYLEQYQMGETDHNTTTNFVRNRTSWPIIGGLFEKYAREEFTNSMQFVRLYKTVFGRIPKVQIPLDMKQMDSVWQRGVGEVATSLVLAARAIQFPDENDMMIIRVIDQEVEQMEQMNIPQDVIVRTSSELATELSLLSHFEVAERLLAKNPLVQVRYFVPTFFRNEHIDIFQHPERHPKLIEEFRAQYEISSDDKLLQQLYMGCIHDAIAIYVPSWKGTVSPVNSFEQFRNEVQRRFAPLLRVVAQEEMEEFGRSIGMLNTIGVTPLDWLEGKDMMWSRFADWDKGPSGEQTVLLPLANDNRPFDSKSMSNKRLLLQQMLITDQIRKMSWMLGVSESQMIGDYTKSLKAAIIMTREQFDHVPLSQEYIQGVRLYIRSLAKHS